MVAPPKPESVSIAEAVDRYIAVLEGRATIGALSPRTVANYAHDLAELVAIIGDTTITDNITGADIDAAILTFGRGEDRRFRDPNHKSGPGRSIATQARFRQSVSHFFTHAEKNAWVQVSPMEWSSLDPQVRGGLRIERTALSLDQARALLIHGPGTPGSGQRAHEQNVERDRFLLGTMLTLGPRVSEVCAANDTDLHVDAGQVLWRIVGKGGKVRLVPWSAWLQKLHRAYVEVRPAPVSGLKPELQSDGARALFRTGHGGRMAPRDVQRMLDRACKRVAAIDPSNARGATPHALRHTAATHMLASGWDVKVVAMLLGHESIATTGRYLDSLPNELADAVSRHPLAI